MASGGAVVRPEASAGLSAHVAKKGLVLQASPVKEAAFTASASVRKGLKPLMPPGVSSS